MRRLLWRWVTATLVLISAITAYIASPFLAAWQLREAIRSGDVATIARKVEWAPVRASLKASLAEHADLLPVATEAGAAIRPTLWQRIKGAFGASMLDRFVESYVTPEGLPQLFAYRKMWREQIKREPDEAKALAWHERAGRFLRRVKRAEFQGFSRVVLEIEDQSTQSRRYRSAFELMGFEWKLVGLEVVGAGSSLSSPTADAPRFAPTLGDAARAAWAIAKDAARGR